MSDISDRIALLSDHFEELIRGAPAGAWSKPTPCSEWTAAELVGHVVDVHAMMLRPLDRSLSPAPAATDDPLGAFRAARSDVAAVLADPQLASTGYDGLLGHAVVEETIDNFLGFDLVIHGWDLARATGQDSELPANEVERIAARCAELGENLRLPGVCGPPVDVPAGTSAQDRLLALLGRDPAWRPEDRETRS
jgi:uncharacterized protein (TIGR03086 family)